MSVLSNLRVQLPAFEKTAMIRMSENPDAWPREILTHLAKAHPYLLQGTQPLVELDEHVDAESGSGFGKVIITNQAAEPAVPERMETGRKEPVPVANAPDELQIPVIIQDFQMRPLDMFYHEGQLHHLSQERVMQVLSAGTMYHTRRMPEDDGQDISEDMQPPDELAFGGMEAYASAWIDKVSASALAEHRDALLQPLEEDPQWASGFVGHPSGATVSKLASSDFRTPTDYEAALQEVIRPQVVRLTRNADATWTGIRVTDAFYRPDTRVYSTEDAVASFRKYLPDLDLAMMTEKDFLFVDGERNTHEPFILESVDGLPMDDVERGRTLVVTQRSEVLDGQVFSTVLDFAGEPTDLRMFVGPNAHAVSMQIFGHPLGKPESLPESSDLVTGASYAFLFGPDAISQPFTLQKVQRHCDHVALTGSDVWGHLSTLHLVPVISPTRCSSITDPGLAEFYGRNDYLIPDSTPLVALGRRVSLLEDASQVRGAIVNRIGSTSKQVREIPVIAPGSAVDPWSMPHYVQVRALPEGYRLRGPYLYPVVGSEEMTGNRKDALFVLTVLGLGLEDAGLVLTVADREGLIHVGNLRPVLMANSIPVKQASIASKIRRNLFKEAAAISQLQTLLAHRPIVKKAEDVPVQGDTVDTILGLGLVNDENIQGFLDAVPLLEQAEATIAELLMQVRIGLPGFEEKPLTNALQQLSNAITQLRGQIQVQEQSGESTLRSA